MMKSGVYLKKDLYDKKARCCSPIRRKKWSLTITGRLFFVLSDESKNCFCRMGQRFQLSQRSLVSSLLVGILLLSPFLEIHGQENNTPLRVITYNIWNGFDWGKDTLRHRQFIDWTSFQKPDILALQELCGYTQAQLEADARRWGHEYAIILKEDGYPVGLTSRWPIQLIAKHREGMWHGMLQVQTGGITVFVVHLSPADWQFRKREAQMITQQLDSLNSDRYLVLGDFNAHSPMDADLDRDRKSLLAKYKTGDAKNEQYQNLRFGYWDYTAMSTFLSQGLIDVSMPFITPAERFSFPTPALTGIWQTASEIKRHRERIDFILASPELAKRCVYSRVLNGPETEGLSDHYPVIADFLIAAGVSKNDP